MELTWMGRYRELIRALVYYSNSSNRNVLGRPISAEENGISQTEYQILEYICEFEHKHKIMADISRDLGILPSIVTKCTKRMYDMGLIEKYRIQGNNKSIVLRPTEKGKELYHTMMSLVSSAFLPFFQQLENATDEELSMFEHAIRSLGSDWGELSDQRVLKLKKIE